MTHTSTEQERAEFEKWWSSPHIWGRGHKEAQWASWQAARRAPVVPQGWKLVPDKPTADMLIALMQWNSETGLTILPQYKAMLAAAPQPPDAATLAHGGVELAQKSVEREHPCGFDAGAAPVGWSLPEAAQDALDWLEDDDVNLTHNIRERLRFALSKAPQPPEATVKDSLTVEAAPVQLPEPWAISHHNRVQYSNAAWYGETPDGTKLYTEQQVRPLLETQKFQLDELAMLTRKLVRSLRKAAPDNESAEKALDYLKRKGLGGNPLRSTQEQST